MAAPHSIDASHPKFEAPHAVVDKGQEQRGIHRELNSQLDQIRARTPTAAPKDQAIPTGAAIDFNNFGDIYHSAVSMDAASRGSQGVVGFDVNGPVVSPQSTDSGQKKSPFGELDPNAFGARPQPDTTLGNKPVSPFGTIGNYAFDAPEAKKSTPPDAAKSPTSAPSDSKSPAIPAAGAPPQIDPVGEGANQVDGVQAGKDTSNGGRWARLGGEIMKEFGQVASVGKYLAGAARGVPVVGDAIQAGSIVKEFQDGAQNASSDAARMAATKAASLGAKVAFTKSVAAAAALIGCETGPVDAAIAIGTNFVAGKLYDSAQDGSLVGFLRGDYANVVSD